jgi:periplasmic mercuric ion binding protein
MMKHLIAITALLFGLLGSGGTWAAEKTVTLKVENMTCALCPITVRKSLEAVEGVQKADVSLIQHTAVVTFDDGKTNVDTLAAATTQVGFPSRPQEKPHK